MERWVFLTRKYPCAMLYSHSACSFLYEQGQYFTKYINMIAMKNSLIVSALILLVGVFQISTVSATESHPAANCHLSSSNADAIVIAFPGTPDSRRIFAPYAPQSFVADAQIPAGTYEVYLEAYDGHGGRASESQSREQFFVEFVDGGSVIAKTSNSKDVAEGVDDAFSSVVTDKELTLTSATNALNIVHAFKDQEGKTQSVSPTCMMLVPQVVEIVPQCGDGKKEASEQCDDGNTTSGDGCSVSCSLERSILDPVCGNSIKEPGEICDDGNGDEISCTRQCTLPEPEPVVVETFADDVDECDGEIGNTIWNDRNSNGVLDEGEEGISDVKVKLQYGDKVKTDRTDYRGRYKFEDLCEDTYRIIVAIEALDASCYATYDKDGKLDHIHKHELDEGEEYRKADFGYKCTSGSHVGKSSPETGPGALAMPIAGSASAIFAGFAAYIARRRSSEKVATIIPMD
jgi:cysteine-rich repeat protein